MACNHEHNEVHAFELAGLGVAPFKLVNVFEGGLAGCDYCFTAIRIHCIIEDANGHRFKVGNVCVGKTGDRGLIDLTKKKINRIRREKKAEKDKARIENAKANLESVRGLLEKKDHPAIVGKTLYDYVTWMFENAGNAGMIKVSKIIEKATEAIDK